MEKKKCLELAKEIYENAEEMVEEHYEAVGNYNAVFTLLKDYKEDLDRDKEAELER